VYSVIGDNASNLSCRCRQDILPVTQEVLEQGNFEILMDAEPLFYGNCGVLAQLKIAVNTIQLSDTTKIQKPLQRLTNTVII